MRLTLVRRAYVAVLCFLSLPAAAQQYQMAEYWFMPPNTYKELHTLYLSIPGNPNCNNGEIATHTFWRGTFMGRDNILLQGGRFDAKANHPGYDIFALEDNGRILYWGTFRGNLPADEAHPFTRPGVWMNPTMTAGPSLESSKVSARVESHELKNLLRRETSAGDYCYTITVADHLDNATNPEDPNAYQWPDVLQVFYTFGDCDSSVRHTEEYWLARGVGTIRFVTSNPNEPSCVKLQWASSSPAAPAPYPGGVPEIPWYDPFKWETYVKNGFFEDPPEGDPPPTAGVLETHARSWRGWSGTPGSGTPNTPDVVLADGGPRATGPWYAVLHVQPNAGWDAAVSDEIRVTPNAKYRLSGWLFRSAGGSNDVYLDMDDLTSDGVVRDVNIGVSAVGTWENVSGDICVGSATTVKVRCVRDTANTAEAGCDGITLQRVGLCDEGGGGSSGGSSGCSGGRPDGICQRSEKYVVLHEDGTTERRTTCPEDCPSCGAVGGTHCSQDSSCPPGHRPIQSTFDCPSCCEVCVDTCGARGGDYCSQDGTCPDGYGALGASCDCNPCCKQGQSCGALGGNYCSQSGTCPGGYSSLGLSFDCNPCCKQNVATPTPTPALPSCGALGGNYCSQSGTCPSGYGSLGLSFDCNPCCKQKPAPPTPTPRPAAPSCGAMGGDHCSQTGKCPGTHDSLGRSSDCNPCCVSKPSCGAMGGDYCAQGGSCPDGFGSLGRSVDCNPCCVSR